MSSVELDNVIRVTFWYQTHFYPVRIFSPIRPVFGVRFVKFLAKGVDSRLRTDAKCFGVPALRLNCPEKDEHGEIQQTYVDRKNDGRRAHHPGAPTSARLHGDHRQGQRSGDGTPIEADRPLDGEDRLRPSEPHHHPVRASAISIDCYPAHELH